MNKAKKIFTLCVSTFAIATMSITFVVTAKNNVSATPDEKDELNFVSTQAEKSDTNKPESISTVSKTKNTENDSSKQTDTTICNGYGGLCYSLMRDAEGNIVSKDIFEQNLDKAITDGIIPESDRSYFVERYDYCSVNSANCGNGNGTGCGNGRGMNRGGGCGMGRGLQ